MDRRIWGMIQRINSLERKVRIMEVCGTHTHSIRKNGIDGILGKNIELISGPGCPVCVTDGGDIDYIYELSKDRENIIVTYGDMLRVMGSHRERSLEKARGEGADIRVVYSPLDGIKIAQNNSEKRVIFLGIGFETTIPGTCRALKIAQNLKVENFRVFSIHKSIKPPMEEIIRDKELSIDGFLIPGHVASIIGEEGFQFLNLEKKCSCITGFTGEEVLYGLYKIVENIKMKNWGIVNGYKSAVRYRGNEKAMKDYWDMFELKDVFWRGLGEIKESGFKLKSGWKAFDIEKEVKLKKRGLLKIENCSCGEVLKGKIKPDQCRQFGINCTPLNPLGPCMVSGEGSCAAFYKYNRL